MSWSTSIRSVKKSEAAAAIDALQVERYGAGDNSPIDDQIAAAKAAAKSLLATVPGPLVTIAFSGHANGVGWQKKEGYANDCINVSVTQLTEADLKYLA